MSKINCDACNELRENASEFVMNGVTTKACTSLENDTGLNPSNANNDAEDLHNINDCAIGRLDGELEAYEVCDWKEFFHKLIPNLYELLKAIICAISGIWKNIHRLWRRTDQLCKSMDNILQLVRGNNPKNHFGTWTDYFKERVEFNSYADWSWDYFFPTFKAQIDDGAGCDEEKRLGRYTHFWAYTDNSNYPFVFSYRYTDDLEVGQVIATFKKEDLNIGTDITEAAFINAMRGGTTVDWGIIHGDTILRVEMRAYLVIDGVEINPQLKEYGEGNPVFIIAGLIGNSKRGGYAGNIINTVRSYDA